MSSSNKHRQHHNGHGGGVVRSSQRGANTVSSYRRRRASMGTELDRPTDTATNENSSSAGTHSTHTSPNKPYHQSAAHVDPNALFGNPYEHRPTSLSVGASPTPQSADIKTGTGYSHHSSHRRGAGSGWFSTAPPTAFPETTLTTPSGNSAGVVVSSPGVCTRCRRSHPNSANCPPLQHSHSHSHAHHSPQHQLQVPYQAQYHAQSPPTTSANGSHNRSTSIPSPIPVDLTSLGGSGSGSVSADASAPNCCQRCEWKIDRLSAALETERAERLAERQSTQRTIEILLSRMSALESAVATATAAAAAAAGAAAARNVTATATAPAAPPTPISDTATATTATATTTATTTTTTTATHTHANSIHPKPTPLVTASSGHHHHPSHHHKSLSAVPALATQIESSAEPKNGRITSGAAVAPASGIAPPLLAALSSLHTTTNRLAKPGGGGLSLGHRHVKFDGEKWVAAALLKQQTGGPGGSGQLSIASAQMLSRSTASFTLGAPLTSAQMAAASGTGSGGGVNSRGGSYPNTPLSATSPPPPAGQQPPAMSVSQPLPIGTGPITAPNSNGSDSSSSNPPTAGVGSNLSSSTASTNSSLGSSPVTSPATSVTGGVGAGGGSSVGVNGGSEPHTNSSTLPRAGSEDKTASTVPPAGSCNTTSTGTGSEAAPPGEPSCNGEGGESDKGAKMYSYSALDEIETVLTELTEISEHTHAPGFQLGLKDVRPDDYPDDLDVADD